MPTPPVDSLYCVHCGYERSGLEPDATECPECGHSLDDIYIPTMAAPPRWWRIHRTGWQLFEYASYAMLATAICLIGGIGALIVYDLASAGAAGTGPVVLLIRDIGAGFAALALLLTFLGGLCAFARVPWNDDREQRDALLLATTSLAVPLMAPIPLLLLVAGALFSREILGVVIILSAALILIDVRTLKARAASFIRFTTNDTQSAFYDAGHRSVDIAAIIAIIGGLFMIFGGARPNLAILAYALMVLGWLGMRGRAAATVRKELTRARRHASTNPAGNL
jgi:hypothetical protein